jgi:signal transduction histidine kinase/ActR/RegA family two-component response regulator
MVLVHDRALAWLRATMWLAAIVPLALFAVVAWALHKQHIAESQLRVDRAARVAEEHAVKVFETNLALLARVGDALGDADDALLRARERPFHDKLVGMTGNLNQLVGLFVIDGNGRVAASNRVFPAVAVDNTDRSFFRHHRAGGAQPFLSEVLTSRTTGELFFSMSMRRNAADGRLTSVLSASMAPSYFVDFYSDLADESPSLRVALLHVDGSVLAVWPPDAAAAATAPPAPERIVSQRRVGSYPVQVRSSIDRSAALAPWYRELMVLAGFGFPIALTLMYVAWVGLQRTQRALLAQQRLHDETAHRQRIEETLRQAQKIEALGRLSGGVAHDFNNLLMVVGNNLYLLRRLQPALAASTHLAAIERAVAAGTKLTRQLLSFSRRQPLRPERVLLQTHLDSIAELVAPAVGATVVVQTEIEPDTAPVQVDVQELELAVLNLAINARDAMPQGGRLRIGVANARAGEPAGFEGRFVVISVHDSGQGVVPELAQRVFEPFFTTKDVGHGTGLGLSQVHGFCARAGGTATFDSRSGEGTTVRMFLPASTLPEPAALATAPDALQSLPGLRVLLVEDNAEVAFATATVLESMGCRVHPSDSADAAIAALRADAQRFDLVLSDIVMCGALDGVGLAAVVQNEYPQLPIVLISGYSSSLDHALALEVPVLPKPSTPAALAAAIRAALARHAVRRAEP